MILIDVKKEGGLDRALKKFKWKFDKTGVVKELRERKVFVKECIKRREEIKKAAYKESKIPK
jgi:small subunit ribosomal protein S21